MGVLPQLAETVPTEPARFMIHDERFKEGLAFAHAARALEHRLPATRGDVTALWYSGQLKAWQDRPILTCGLTTPDALFCLERLAWDARLRMLLRVDHHRRSDGHVEHHVEAPHQGSWVQARLRTAGHDIGGVSADIVTPWQGGGHQMPATAGLPHPAGNVCPRSQTPHPLTASAPRPRNRPRQPDRDGQGQAGARHSPGS